MISKRWCLGSVEDWMQVSPKDQFGEAIQCALFASSDHSLREYEHWKYRWSLDSAEPLHRMQAGSV